MFVYHHHGHHSDTLLLWVAGIVVAWLRTKETCLGSRSTLDANNRRKVLTFEELL